MISKMKNYKKISIIIVNFKSQDNLRACVSSILNKLKQGSFEIIIVNNDAQENVLNETIGLPEIQIINLEKNVGFGTAINTGAKIAQGEWLMLLNPDARLLTSQQKMFDFFAATPEAGIISPKLVREDGKVQEWSAGVNPNLFDLVRNNFGFPKSKKLWESQETKEADWSSGAAMVVKRDIFDKIGGFDENIFMYFEDIDLCKRAREAGKKVFYFPQDEVAHFGGKSAKNKKKQKADYYKSQDYYFQKHFGRAYSKCIRGLRKIFRQA